jgi:2-deoxy-D-gluconate 3-dehydrogenase
MPNALPIDKALSQASAACPGGTPEAAHVKLFDLEGKVAIVTGGNGGIGLGIAQALASAGAKVAIVGRNPEKTTAAAEYLADAHRVGAQAVVADVARPDQIDHIAEQVMQRFKAIDILFNNAGINIRRPPQEMSLEQWQTVLDVNLTSAFLLSKAVYPAMREAGAGKIINIGSMTSIFGASFAPAYATSKGGIVQLTKSLALAWAKDNIQVNAILPGWFDTELTQQARVEVPELHAKVTERIPMGRWGKPEDMAGAAVWLAGRGSDYVTGIALPVDGGYTSAL